MLLQGHTNEITCVSVSDNKRWIATCDAGSESMVVVWDSIKVTTNNYLLASIPKPELIIFLFLQAIPVKTIFDPHSKGIRSIHISHNSMYLVTLGCPENDGTTQTISVWEWASENVEPLHTCTIQIGKSSQDELDAYHEHYEQTFVRFHQENSNLILTSGPKDVIFWSWENGRLESFSPTFEERELGGTIGQFTQSTFIPGTAMAATATTDGKIIIWDVKSVSGSHLEKYVLKVVEVHRNCRINYLSTVGRYIVTGGDDGFVRFLDHQLRLEAWFEEFDAGPVISVSFEKPLHGHHSTSNTIQTTWTATSDGISSGKSASDHDDKLRTANDNGEQYLTGDTSSQFQCPNFVVATTTAVIIHVESSAFADLDNEKIRGKIVVQGQSGPVQCLACHPTKPYLAISGFSGYIHVWNYVSKTLITFIRMNGLFVASLQFDHKGQFMVAGCTNGVIKVFETTSFREIQAFKTSKNSIQSIQFSHDSLYFAFFDTDNCVGVFRWDYRDEDQRKPVEWVYLGRYRSHKNPVIGIQFGVPDYGETPRLMSVGEDRRMVEYSLADSSITEGIKIRAVHKIGQSAIPTAFLWVSRDAHCMTIQYSNEHPEHNCLLFADDQYKFSNFLTPDNSDTRCTKTSLCPVFGGPLNRLILVPKSEGSQELGEEQEDYENHQAVHDKQKSVGPPFQFIAYSTHKKVIGLVHLPLDGNPNRSMGLVAHSGVITDCVVSSDGKYLFTAGGIDHTVNFWSIKGEYLREQATKRLEIEDGIVDVNNTEPYVRLIEGGRHGKFFSEIKQFFYYAQIRSQGEVTTSERKITGRVPLNQIPDVVRALGFYASHYEIQNLLTEMKLALGYDPNLTTELKDITVDFDTFVKLFVNHRPVMGTTVRDIKDAFVAIGAEPMSGIIFSESFFQALMSRGETMSEEDVNTALSVLLEEDITHSNLEERFSAEQFAQLLDFAHDPHQEEGIDSQIHDNDDIEDELEEGE